MLSEFAFSTLEKMGSAAQEEQYHLKWNDYHSSLTKYFRDLRENDDMVDVAIVSDGRTFKAHKLVLSACSPVFKDMLRKSRNQPFMQPLIFLHGVSRDNVEAILDFMYNGEVSINQEDLQTFLSIAEDLQVRGLTQSNSQEANQAKESSRKRPRISQHSDDEEEYQDKTPRKSTIHHPRLESPYAQDYPRRSSNASIDQGPTGNLTYHYLGGRDQDDPMTNLMVTHSDRGWHCPDCIHVATTKGNLKSHILRDRTSTRLTPVTSRSRMPSSA